MFNCLWFAFCQWFEMWFNHWSLVNTPWIFNFAYNTPFQPPFCYCGSKSIGIFSFVFVLIPLWCFNGPYLLITLSNSWSPLWFVCFISMVMGIMLEKEMKILPFWKAIFQNILPLKVVQKVAFQHHLPFFWNASFHSPNKY